MHAWRSVTCLVSSWLLLLQSTLLLLLLLTYNGSITAFAEQTLQIEQFG
jgi:hypothetical protein